MNTVSPQSYPHGLNSSNTNHACVDNSVDSLCSKLENAAIPAALTVIPAKAGTQKKSLNWVPAFAGMTTLAGMKL